MKLFKQNGVVHLNKPNFSHKRILKPVTGAKRSSIKDELDFLKSTGKIRVCLYRALGGIGDILMITPTLKAIKEAYPEHHLTFAINTRDTDDYYDVVKNNPYIDEIISANECNREDYHLFKDLTSPCLAYENSGAAPLNRIDIFAATCGFKLKDHLPFYKVEPEEEVWASEFLLKHNKSNLKTIMLHTASFDKKRTWPIHKYTELISYLNKTGEYLYLINDWQNLNPSWSHMKNVVNISHHKLREKSALTAKIDCYVGPDSGPMHIAGALGTKGVVLFGSIDPKVRINYYPNLEGVTIQGMACLGCLHPNEPVLTSGGLKPICDILENDKIFDIKGNLVIVEKIHIHKNSHQMLEINLAKTNIPLFITDNHKVPCVLKTHNRKTNRKKLILKNEITDTEIGNLKPGDYLFYPKIKLNGDGVVKIQNTTHHSVKQLPSEIILTEEIAWLFGHYVAEGSCNGSSLSFCTHDKELWIREKLNFIFNKYFGVGGTEHKQKSCLATDFRVNSITLKKVFAELFGTNAHNKKIPLEILPDDPKIISALLDGLFAGDGYTEKENIVLATVSETLAYQARELMMYLGEMPRIYKRIAKAGYKPGGHVYRIELSSKGTKSKEFMVTEALFDKKLYSRDIVYKNGFLVPIKSITKISYDEDVYNLTVSDSHTYNIKGIAVHNCMYKPCPYNLKCMTGLSAERVGQRIEAKLNEAV